MSLPHCIKITCWVTDFEPETFIDILVITVIYLPAVYNKSHGQLYLYPCSPSGSTIYTCFMKCKKGGDNLFIDDL